MRAPAALLLLKRSLPILGLTLFLGGCSWWSNPFAIGFRNVVLDPIEFCISGDRAVMHSRHYRLATAAWQEIAGGQLTETYSRDYVRGFKEGFADYLDAGGTGEPPPVPPRCYWHNDYRTPEGHQAIQDWFAGFRHGAGCAKQSGLRHYAVIPSSLLVAQPVAQVPSQGPAAEPPQEVIPAPSPVGAKLPSAKPTWRVPQRPVSQTIQHKDASQPGYAYPDGP